MSDFGPICLIIRCCTTLKDLFLNIDSDKITVLDLRNLVATQSNLKATTVRLVYRGKVMEEESTLKDYDVQDGSVIYFSKSGIKENENANTQSLKLATAFNTKEDPNNLKFSGSFAKSMSSNPEVVRSMIMSNPMIKKMMSKNPEIAHIINDPTFLKQTIKVSQNPQIMREALKNNDRAISNLEMMPGGFNHLTKMYYNLHEPAEREKGLSERNKKTDCNTNEENDLIGKLNTEPLPNVWNSKKCCPKKTRRRSVGSKDMLSTNNLVPKMLNMKPPSQSENKQSSLFPIEKTETSSIKENSSIITNSSEPLEDRFKPQLQRLNEMGFMDSSQNIRALQVAGGDVDTAVELLLSSEN